MIAFQEYLAKGGVFIYPILVFAVWAFTLIVERTIYYIQVASRTTKLRTDFFKILENDSIENAAGFLKTKSEKGILQSVLLTALNNKGHEVAKLEKKVQADLLEKLPTLSRFLNLIATLGGLMPILGLLGTVTGMIATFKVIALQGTGDAQAMADGISEALITTQAGLVAAVPVVLGHTFLTNRLNKIVAVVKESTFKVVDILEDKKEV